MSRGNYRNPALLKAARECPTCLNPWCEFGPRYEEGSIVACHSNLQRHGKGTGLKAHDIPAFLCPGCHRCLDGQAGDWDPRKKQFVFLETVYQTFLWLLRRERLKIQPSKAAA